MLSSTGEKSPRDLAWDHALTARMNVLYYRRKLKQLWWIDFSIRLVAAITASAAVAGLVSNLFPEVGKWLAAVAALGSIISLIAGLPDRIRKLAILLVEYTAHVSAFEALFRRRATAEQVELALDAFAETEKREAQDDLARPPAAPGPGPSWTATDSSAWRRRARKRSARPAFDQARSDEHRVAGRAEGPSRRAT